MQCCLTNTDTDLSFYSLTASVSPSPTVSMLSVIRVSLYNFLFSLSMATVSASSGAGFTTLPPHSTWSTRKTFVRTIYRLKWLKYLSRQTLVRCRLQWCLLFSTAAETFRNSCHSWLCLRQWRQSQTSQPGQKTGDRLKETRWHSEKLVQCFVVVP